MNTSQLTRYEKPEVEFEPPRYFTKHELWEASQKRIKPRFVFDVECYPNYWCVVFICTETGWCWSFELDDNQDFDRDFLRWFLDTFLLIGFNNHHYDEPQLWAAVAGFDNSQLKGLSNATIQGEMRHSEVEVMFQFNIGYCNSIDLMEPTPAPGRNPLKLFAARLYSDVLQELPYEHHQFLDVEERRFVHAYCINDCRVTLEVFNMLKVPLELRADLTRQYGEDLRSKSDPQLCEALILNECEKLSGVRARKKYGKKSGSVVVDIPDFIKFGGEQLNFLLDSIKKTIFVVDDSGKVILPSHIKNYILKIGTSRYQIGIGGLHSKEKKIAYETNDRYQLLDTDVASYYPTSILNCGIYPPQLGEDFKVVYQSLYDRRLEAKAIAGDRSRPEAERAEAKSISDSLKIALNGAFGKLGSAYSPLYDPASMLKVTLTGQLALLMLIEAAEWLGISIVSANTDGIVAYCEKTKLDQYREVVKRWEAATNYTMEETLYKAVYSASVNSYIAITQPTKKKEKAKAKAKGSLYLTRMTMPEVNRDSLMKACVFEICPEAVTKFLLDGVSIERTIRNCKDPAKFTTFQKVNGGARIYKTELGNLVRWYMSKKSFGTIQRIDNGNRVKHSMGALPMMVLPKTVPTDIDYDWYITYANRLLADTGYNKLRQSQKRLF